MSKELALMKRYAETADFWSIYILGEDHEELSIRKGVQEPISSSSDHGALITIMKKGGLGYAATQDLSEEGIKWACKKALAWAEHFAPFSLLKDLKKMPFSAHQAKYQGPAATPLRDVDLITKFELLRLADKSLQSSSKIVDCEASLWAIDSQVFFINSLGSEITQRFHKLIPSLSATANDNGITQIRTLGGMRAYCQQGGFETILAINLAAQAEKIAKEAIDLIYADNCPSANMDVVIDPDQMMLQIHESIGHPLELDRILGDERNYAGTSFVTLDMFGSYQYGSKLLNITFDPSIKEQFASYGYDDEGTKAEKDFIIKDGILKKPLGASIAQGRANIAGVANARSCSWNRPPIDRMANLNLEPGQSSFKEIIASVENGIYLKSNSSWSIDDSRNKFQFGCEWGQLIKDGKLGKVVRNPNYRGISANFWRNLSMVGDNSTFMVMGTPFCGKGEPNQSIHVGHASPICRFSNVDVFGGE